MKTNKTIYALSFVAILALAAAGCRHRPVGVTKMPGMTMPAATDQNPSTVGPGTTINPGEQASGLQGGGPLTSLTEFEGMLMDTQTLAAYTIHFAYDSAVIRDSEQANLQSVAQALSANPSDKLLIEGNCDERGTEEYNRALGERRALAARQALAKLGVDPRLIRTESFGKDKPVDPGHDEAAWAKNRRDDFVLLLPKTGT
jgi:peptidoglycan-associated lipoprotein